MSQIEKRSLLKLEIAHVLFYISRHWFGSWQVQIATREPPPALSLQACFLKLSFHFKIAMKPLHAREPPQNPRFPSIFQAPHSPSSSIIIPRLQCSSAISSQPWRLSALPSAIVPAFRAITEEAGCMHELLGKKTKCIATTYSVTKVIMFMTIITTTTPNSILVL